MKDWWKTKAIRHMHSQPKCECKLYRPKQVCHTCHDNDRTSPRELPEALTVSRKCLSQTMNGSASAPSSQPAFPVCHISEPAGLNHIPESVSASSRDPRRRLCRSMGSPDRNTSGSLTCSLALLGICYDAFRKFQPLKRPHET